MICFRSYALEYITSSNISISHTEELVAGETIVAGRVILIFTL